MEVEVSSSFPNYWEKIDETDAIWQARDYGFNVWSRSKVEEKGILRAIDLICDELERTGREKRGEMTVAFDFDSDEKRRTETLEATIFTGCGSGRILRQRVQLR